MWWHRGHVKRPPPPLLALAAGLAQQASARPVPPTSTRRALAAATAAASVGMAAAAATQFRAHHTTVEPFDPSKATALVVSGPNAVTRNPMYVGMAGVLVANAIRLRDWRAVLPVVAFVGATSTASRSLPRSRRSPRSSAPSTRRTARPSRAGFRPHRRRVHERGARADRPLTRGPEQARLAHRPEQAVVDLRPAQDRARVLRRPVHRPRRRADLLRGAGAVPRALSRCCRSLGLVGQGRSDGRRRSLGSCATSAPASVADILEPDARGAQPSSAAGLALVARPRRSRSGRRRATSARSAGR